MRTAVVVPAWNGEWWLPGCLSAIAAQTYPPNELIVVDNGSADRSVAIAHEHGARVLELGRNTGFAYAANRGIETADAEAVALVNSDVELAPDWLERATWALRPGYGSVATKMVELGNHGRIDDAGDVLRRDGVCEQRGRFTPDDGRFDEPGDVFAACAGAALYRREAVLAVGGFDERFFAYLEDVDLGLRLQLAGWRCAYEPAVAAHASGGSSWQLERPVPAWVARNTVLLVAKAFPLRWLPLVLYRQAGWVAHAARERRLRAWLGGLAAALPLLPAMVRERSRLRAGAVVPVDTVVPARPWRGRTS